MINDKMFRAMCVFPDAWVYGYLAKNFEGYWIYDGNHVPYLIDVNSLGMATGMKDVNGVEINFYLLREENEQEKESRLRKESNREAAKKEERRLEYLVLKKEFGE